MAEEDQPIEEPHQPIVDDTFDEKFDLEPFDVDGYKEDKPVELDALEQSVAKAFEDGDFDTAERGLKLAERRGNGLGYNELSAAMSGSPLMLDYYNGLTEMRLGAKVPSYSVSKLPQFSGREGFLEKLALASKKKQGRSFAETMALEQLKQKGRQDLEGTKAINRGNLVDQKGELTSIRDQFKGEQDLILSNNNYSNKEKAALLKSSRDREDQAVENNFKASESKFKRDSQELVAGGRNKTSENNNIRTTGTSSGNTASKNATSLRLQKLKADAARRKAKVGQNFKVSQAKISNKRDVEKEAVKNKHAFALEKFKNDNSIASTDQKAAIKDKQTALKAINDAKVATVSHIRALDIDKKKEKAAIGKVRLATKVAIDKAKQAAITSKDLELFKSKLKAIESTAQAKVNRDARKLVEKNLNDRQAKGFANSKAQKKTASDLKVKESKLIPSGDSVKMKRLEFDKHKYKQDYERDIVTSDRNFKQSSSKNKNLADNNKGKLDLSRKKFQNTMLVQSTALHERIAALARKFRLGDMKRADLKFKTIRSELKALISIKEKNSISTTRDIKKLHDLNLMLQGIKKNGTK